jgi:exoribonuclease-2
MSHVVFEEDGGFKAASVLSEAQGALQVEYASGKRGKIKASHVLMRFDQPEPSQILRDAQATQEAIDLSFLWECAPQDEFDFESLAADYFGDRPSAGQRFGLLLKLHQAPVYFHRKGRGRYRPASPEVLQAALAALERKRLQEEQVLAMAQALQQGKTPPEIAAQAGALLVKPDKQSLGFKALEKASEASGMSPQRLLLQAGAFASVADLHFAKFAAEHFPRGAAHDASMVPALSVLHGPTSEAPANAFSIDDSSTTEIDDALSVRQVDDAHWEIGVHIAAPSAMIAPGTDLDRLARQRMSTVYMPGDKITMLPDAVVDACSLDAGKRVPCLSLFSVVSASDWMVRSTRTELQWLTVATNLRHDTLDGLVTPQALESPQSPDSALDFHWEALRVLWPFAQALTKQREQVRGKPEPKFRSDFSFYINEAQQVRIVQRRRDAPLDRIVAEMMILANSQWGLLLAQHSVPGIYRSQAAGRVRTTTHPLPHQGLGVKQYIWSTSPLRRYTDLVNQRQILAASQQRAAPFAPNDSDLFAVISAFDAKYDAYAEFQSVMERFWCLRWIEQQALERVAAVTVREDLVRLADAPFYFRLAGLPELAAGRRIWVQVVATDTLELRLEGRFIEVDAGPAIDLELPDDEPAPPPADALTASAGAGAS